MAQVRRESDVRAKFATVTNEAIPKPVTTPAAEPAPVIVKKHASWFRECWILLVFGAGLVFGALGTLTVTTALFPIAKDATQDAFMAGQVTGAVTGKR